MNITELRKRSHTNHSKKLVRRFNKLELLINELNKREISNKFAKTINEEVNKVNTISDSDKLLLKQLRKSQWNILKFIEKELKLVPKNHYQNRWMAIGMSAFGIPMGVSFGASFDNMAYIGIGIPIGMVIGMAIGSRMDKKAQEEGRQLDIDINF